MFNITMYFEPVVTGAVVRRWRTGRCTYVSREVVDAGSCFCGRCFGVALDARRNLYLRMYVKY